VQKELLVRAGQPPCIHIGRKVLQGGRKHTTYIVGCELFRLEPKALASDLQRLLAASATLQPAAPLGLPCSSEHAAAASLSGGHQLMAVIVQGDEVKRVRAHLMSAAVGLPGRLVVADA
jgi:translation initiation factor 1 (eIF-1/SUI1)